MRRWIVVVLALASAGCDTDQIESAVRGIANELTERSLKELGDLASRVAENPGVADSILAANGVDVSQLDSMLSELGAQAEVVAGALADIPVGEMGDLATRIAEDRSVADSLLSANGIEVGQLDEVLDRIGPDAEALAAYLTSLRGEGGR